MRFLHTVADDPRFNAGELLKAIDGLTNLSWMRRMQYPNAAHPRHTPRASAAEKEFAWMDRNPDWGVGRIDPFNPIRFRLLKQPIDTSIGNADMMPLWNMKGRTAIHWDGLTTSFHESMLSSGIGNGASRSRSGSQARAPRAVAHGAALSPLSARDRRTRWPRAASPSSPSTARPAMRPAARARVLSCRSAKSAPMRIA